MFCVPKSDIINPTSYLVIYKSITIMKRTAIISIGTFVLNRIRNVANIHRYFNKRVTNEVVIGHGSHQYKVKPNWGTPPDPTKYPVIDCHEMVVDKLGRIILLTNHPQNNILIYNQDGDIIESWTLDLKDAHGLTLVEEENQERLFICDYNAARVIKTDLKGNILLELEPPTQGVFADPNAYFPTETAVAKNGDIYVVDAYGASCVVQYNKEGKYIKHFGGKGKLEENLNQSHGITIDTRQGKPTLLVSSRVDCSFKRFTLNGDYIETITIPGAFVGRPVIKGDYLYAACCWSNKLMSPNSGFITILDKNDKVVSNPGGIAPVYENGVLNKLKQAERVFSHCHDICLDNDDNVYVCEWNAGGRYPIKLERI